MIANLINQVLQAMSKTLGNQQIERLKDVLETTFSNIEIIEKTESDAAIDTGVIQTFLSAKCSVMQPICVPKHRDAAPTLWNRAIMRKFQRAFRKQ